MSSHTAALRRSRQRGVNATVGMAIFLGAVAMLFAALFFAYAVVRGQAPAWPPPGHAPLPRAALAGNTLVLLAASLCLRAAVAAARRRDLGAARRRAGLALALGGGFLALQGLVWRGLAAVGAGPASGVLGSVFFALSGFHALHVLGGVVAAAVVVRRLAAAPVEVARLRLSLLALYWDFVLGVWGVFYVAVCLL